MNADKYSNLVGRVVNVNEKTHTGEFGEFTEVSLKDDDPIVSEVLGQHQGPVRFWTPGMMGTMEFRPGRLNVYIGKDKDGVHKVERVSFG